MNLEEEKFQFELHAKVEELWKHKAQVPTLVELDGNWLPPSPHGKKISS